MHVVGVIPSGALMVKHLVHCDDVFKRTREGPGGVFSYESHFMRGGSLGCRVSAQVVEKAGALVRGSERFDAICVLFWMPRRPPAKF